MVRGSRQGRREHKVESMGQKVGSREQGVGSRMQKVRGRG